MGVNAKIVQFWMIWVVPSFSDTSICAYTIMTMIRIVDNTIHYMIILRNIINIISIMITMRITTIIV